MTSSSSALWLRWSWRDLRKRWLLVMTIATIIALGTGAYAGLGSTAAWRRQSNDESFALLAMHDLRVTLAQGATVEVGALDAAVRSTLGAVLDGGIVLSRKAADDLGAAVGDSIRLRHPARDGFSYRMVDSAVPVAAIHPSPMRFSAYLDLGQAALFGMEGLTNLVQVTPVDGVTDAELVRSVFGLPGVGSVQSVTAATTLFMDALDEYFGVLRVAELIVLALALLIAFNATSISVDERSREHATMQAFGLGPRTVLRLVTVEIVLVGVIGTCIGVLAGRGLLGWILVSQLEQTMPDFGVVPYVSPGTVATAILLGVVAVSLAPLLTARRVSRIDIPSTLRVIE